MLTLSHTGLSSTHDSARTHIPLHPLHLSALRDISSTWWGLTEPGRPSEKLLGAQRTFAILGEPGRILANEGEP